MTEQIGEFVPFNQVHSQVVKFEDVLPLPVDQQRLGVNLGQIESLCHLSRIGRLYVIGDHSGPISVRVPYIVGATPGGNPRILGAVAELVPPFSPSLSPMKDQEKKLTEARIKINMREVTQILLRLDRVKFPEGIRSPSAWAIALDSILKDSFLLFASKNLDWWDFKSKMNIGPTVNRTALFAAISN